MQRRRQPRSQFGQVVGAFALQIASIGRLRRENALLFAVMLAGSLAALWLWHEWADVIGFLSVGILGSLAEVIFVCFGVWHYANPTLLGIPVWFPLAFGTSALIGQQLVRTLTALWKNARWGWACQREAKALLPARPSAAPPIVHNSPGKAKCLGGHAAEPFDRLGDACNNPCRCLQRTVRPGQCARRLS
jgi:hypothetical protein